MMLTYRADQRCSHTTAVFLSVFYLCYIVPEIGSRPYRDGLHTACGTNTVTEELAVNKYLLHGQQFERIGKIERKFQR